jgi:pantoate--beta-alanine ligase
MVVQRLLVLQGYPTQLHACPILREGDGLAMSSRNLRLGAIEREKATGIYRALNWLKANWSDPPNSRNGTPDLYEGKVERARAILEENDFRIDYVEIADARTLEPIRQAAGAQGAIALVAAFQGEVRLIDNMLL